MIIYHLHHATHQLAPTGQPPDVCKGQPLFDQKEITLADEVSFH